MYIILRIRNVTMCLNWVNSWSQIDLNTMQRAWTILYWVRIVVLSYLWPWL